MIVYKITNLLDSKQYIGQTIQELHKRWIQHKSDASSRKNHSVLHRAINKHGIENFEIKILTNCNSIEEMNHREQYYIKLFDTLAPKGYNVTTGGKNHRHTEESRRKLSNAKKGKKTGKTWNKGISHSIETLIKLRNIQRGENNGMFGKKHSSKTRQLISKKAKNRHTSISQIELLRKLAKNKRKSILCHQTGMIFNSVVETATFFNISPQSVTQVAKGQRKQCNGLTFSYY